jgi:hypothetical protein
VKIRTTFALTLSFLLLAGLALADHHLKTESGWFDFEGCAFCKTLLEDPGLMDNTTWETHAVSNGMLTIMTVAPGYEESMAKAAQAMNQLGMDMQNGKVNPMTVPMCGHCQAFGMTMMSGKVKMEEVRGDAATVQLATSDDEAVVKQLHDIVARNQKEMASMMGDHAGHQH